MSILNALQNQASALDDYENRISNGMNNFALEKQIYDQSDLAFKQGKALANQVFTQGQLENLSLAVPAVYGLTKGAYTRYKSGKPILPTREEISNSVRNFGRGQFNRGAKSTVDTLKKALPDDLVKLYNDKYDGKLPTNLNELQDHVNTLKDLAKQKISGTVQEQTQQLSEQAADIGRRATGSVPPKADTLLNRPYASAEDLAKPLGPEPGEALSELSVPPLGFQGGRADEGGPAFVSPQELALQAFHNENLKQFQGFPDNVKDIITKRMDDMGVLDETNPDGTLSRGKLELHSGILAEAAGQYGLPKALGVGGAPSAGTQGFNADLRWDVRDGIGQLVNKNTGEPVQDLRTFGAEDRAPSQQYRDISQEADDRIFSAPSRTLGQILPFEDPERPQPSIPLGEPQQPTELEARQQRLVEDPARFVPDVPARGVPVGSPAQPELPDVSDLVARQTAATTAARAQEPTPAINQPDETGISQLDRTEDRITRVDISNEDFFRDLGKGLPAQPPPPSRDTLRTTGGRTANIEDLGQRGDLRGPYGSTAEQGAGTAPTATTALPVADRTRPLASAEDLAKPLGAEPSQQDVLSKADAVAAEGKANIQASIDKTPVEEKVGGRVTEEDAGGAAGGVAALGEGVLTATDKGLTTGEKVGSIAKQGASLGAFLAGGPELGVAVSGAEILGSGESGAMKAKQIGTMGAEVGGAAAASALVPGFGELIMGGLAIGGLIKDIVDRKKENKEQAEAQPTAPRAPQPMGIAFDSAPVINSSDFHEL